MVMAKLPDGAIKTKLQSGAVGILYHDLCHPPATLLGTQHIWRTADGSYNNVNDPKLGKAGNNYSRSVQQQHPLPPSQLPDPGLLFDSLLKREHVSLQCFYRFLIRVLFLFMCIYAYIRAYLPSLHLTRFRVLIRHSKHLLWRLYRRAPVFISVSRSYMHSTLPLFLLF
jgi:hypothetical protein